MLRIYHCKNNALREKKEEKQNASAKHQSKHTWLLNKKKSNLAVEILPQELFPSKLSKHTESLPRCQEPLSCRIRTPVWSYIWERLSLQCSQSFLVRIALDERVLRGAN